MTKEQNDLALLTDAANRLNRMVELDRETMQNLFAPVFLCNDKLPESTAVCFPVDEALAINVLGLVLGIVPTQTDQYTIAVELINRKLVGFKVINCKND